jgi:hypothetical protein
MPCFEDFLKPSNVLFPEEVTPWPKVKMIEGFSKKADIN